MLAAHRRCIFFVLLSASTLLAATTLLGWQRFRNPFRPSRSGVVTGDADEPAEFYFGRLAYSGGGWGWRGGSWATDYPEAEYHFMQGVRRLTNLDCAQGSRVVRALDEELFDHPWLYAVEVGHWDLSPEEAARLREYLLRGGFMIVDDFHGTYEWAGFLQSMRRVLPERPILELESGEAVMHVLYDLDQRVQIPGIWPIMNGVTYEKDGYVSHWRGIYDDDGRLMVAINFNMDLGDAWEHADTPEYPENMTALAYRFGINYIIYAMTH